MDTVQRLTSPGMSAARRPVRRRLPGRATTVSAAGLVAATLLATGCGGDKKADAKPKPTAELQVRAVVRAFGAASAAKDYAAICDRLIAKSLSDNVEELGLPCEEAFAKGLGSVEGARLRIDGVRLDGAVKAYAKVHTTAVGQAPSDDVLELIRVGGAWRIASLSAPAAQAPKAPALKFW